MSKKPAAIPLFADAYLADTTHLTTEEHGAYLLLLMAAWRQEDCALPNDDRKLARIAGMSRQKWAAVRDTIIEFWTVEDGRIFQHRLRRERAWVAQKSEGSRKSARARWDNQPVENKQSEDMRSQCDGNAPPPPPIPLSKDNGADDPGKQFWDSARGYLGNAKAGFAAKLAKQYGQELVATAITKAMLTSPQPADRATYVAGILKRMATERDEVPIC